MKMIAKVAAAAVLSTAAFTASAWWGGPGWGYPGWGYGGYAPVYAVPAYGYAPVAPWGGAPWGGAPWGPGGFDDPVFGNMEDFSKAPELPEEVKARMDESSAAFEQAKKISKARTEAFNKRSEMDRAAAEARRQAWRDSMPQRPAMGDAWSFPAPAPFAMPAAPAAAE